MKFHLGTMEKKNLGGFLPSATRGSFGSNTRDSSQPRRSFENGTRDRRGRKGERERKKILRENGSQEDPFLIIKKGRFHDRDKHPEFSRKRPWNFVAVIKQAPGIPQAIR